MTCAHAKFEVATSKGLGGDAFTRNMTGALRDDGRRTLNCGTKLIYKKKVGIIIMIITTLDTCGFYKSMTLFAS